MGEPAGVGVGHPKKLAIAPHAALVLGIHMDSDRPERKEGGRKERHREDGGMPACLPPGTQIILVVCLLDPPFKRYQLKTDPGLIKL